MSTETRRSGKPTNDDNKNIIVKVEDLSIAYNETPVIWDVDINIYEGTRTAIVGPNGAGKSTLLKGILGLMPLITGSVQIMGSTYKEHYKKIAYVPQRAGINWDFPATVLDVVLMGRYSHLGWIKRPSKKDVQKACDALEQIKMLEFKDRQISQLSGGQRQRVFLARAIVQDAQLYFMDEPLQGVDIKTVGIIMDTLKQFQKEKKTTVLVHHDLNTVQEYFDHLIMLNKVTVAQGTVEEAFTDKNIAKAYGVKEVAYVS